VEDWFRRQRLTHKQAVVIKVTHFNTLFYRLAWSEKETTDKAYAELTDRWAKVLPILGLVFPAAGPGPGAVDPTSTFGDWLAALTTTEQQLSCLLNAYAGRTAIENLNGPVYWRDQFRARLADLDTKRGAFIKFDSATVLRHFDTYSKVNQMHQDLQDQLRTFIDAVNLMQNGVPHTIPEKPAGTQVAVTVTAQSLKDSSETADSATFRYFVGSDKPLIYHMGYTYGRVRDIQFDKVRALSGQDLFTATSTSPEDTESAASDLTAMLSWELANAGPDQRFGFLATLGTGFTNPGEVFYYGGSIRIFSKLVVTGGYVTAKTTAGEGASTDSSPSGANRTVFASVRQLWRNKPFVGVSFRLY
jgi:hypothetical protein